MSARHVPHCQDALRWLKDRGWDLAPLTGQDRAALEAVAHCWQLWTVGDLAGQRAAVDAVAALVDGCQEVCWPMARELVAQAGDWSHRALIWDSVALLVERRMAQRGLVVDLGRVRRLLNCHKGLTQVHK